LVGLFIGNIIVAGVQFIPDFPLESMTIPRWAVILSLGFSAAVGIIFGMFPAIKASMLNPIDALRHE
jgi:putative ABC transport system permease protein